MMSIAKADKASLVGAIFLLNPLESYDPSLIKQDVQQRKRRGRTQKLGGQEKRSLRLVCCCCVVPVVRNNRPRIIDSKSTCIAHHVQCIPIACHKVGKGKKTLTWEVQHYGERDVCSLDPWVDNVQQMSASVHQRLKGLEVGWKAFAIPLNLAPSSYR